VGGLFFGNAVDYLMKELEVQRTGLEVDASLDTK
jgi:hypothetical protein